MIIIDEDADRQLLQTLKQFVREPKVLHGVQLYFPEQAIDHKTLHEFVVPLIKKEITDQDAKIFFSAGQLLILADTYTREAHKLAIQLYKALGIQGKLECFEPKDQAAKIILSLEKKFSDDEQARLKQVEMDKKQIHINEAEKKRQSILSVENTVQSAEEIKGKREKRGEKEIMVIEDDAFSRRLVERILNKNYHVTSLGDTEFALHSYRRLAPDMLFLDINLPNVTGHELLEKILEMDPQAYVVMLSGNADRENITEAMKRGAKGFVAKPFTPDELHQYIQRCPTIH